MLVTTLDITIEGVAYKAGDPVSPDTPAGCLESCLRQGKLVEGENPADASVDGSVDGDAPKKKKK